MTTKRNKTSGPDCSGPESSPGMRLSYALRGPPAAESIGVPGYAGVTRHMLARLLKLRESGPISRMDTTEFQHAVDAANAWIAKADEIEVEARTGGFAVEAYRCYCDQARKIMHDVRADAWIDPHRDAQAKRRKDKPAVLDWRADDGRNGRIRATHARLVKAGETDATAKVASEFELSKSQIRRIVARA